MTERKSRFGDRSALPEDPALKVLELRPRILGPEGTSAKTYPGRLAEEDGRSLAARLAGAREEVVGVRDQLEHERAERKQEMLQGLVLVRLDPESIGLTEYANRSQLSLTTKDETFARFKAGIKAKGQDTPVRVRPSAPGSSTPYELCEGHRRLAAIRELNRETEGGFPILARLDAKAADALDLVLKMYRENADREDLSAFEYGTMFAQWLSTGLCKTQREIAAHVGLKESTISQYLTIASLPPEVLEAFGDVRTIAMRWSPALAKACKEHLTETLARARKQIKLNPRADAEAVYKSLTAEVAVGRARKRGSKKSDMVYVDDKVLFKIALKDKHLTFSRWQVEPEQVQTLYDDVKAFFDEWLKTHAKSRI